MSEQNQDPSGVPESDVSDVAGKVDAVSVDDQPKKNTVAYETYKRSVNAEKKFKSENEALKARLDAYEKDKLESEGKYKELNDQLRKEIEHTKSARKSDAAGFIQAQLQSQLEVEAAKHGCIDTEVLMSLANLPGLVEDVDMDTYRAAPDKIVEEVERVRKARPYLFEKPTPKIDPTMPKGPGPKDDSYEDALRKCRTQRELDAVRKKYGRE